jgi:ABC-type nitrate/sulfonate/bicarbonate transport system substrate-binding protein
MSPRPRFRAIAAGVICVLMLLACTGPTTVARDSLVFMAGYKPQANLPFVAVYVAQEKGLFADEGLTVEIQHSAGGGEHLQLLVAGKVQVTTQDAAVMLKRRIDPGLPLVSSGDNRHSLHWQIRESRHSKVGEGAR